jgi:hypothetical protein
MVVGEIERIPGIRKKMHKFSNAAMIWWGGELKEYSIWLKLGAWGWMSHSEGGLRKKEEADLARSK